MGSSNYITDKVQRALAAFLKAQTFTGIPAAQIYKGIEHVAQENEDLEQTSRVLPCIECLCTEADADTMEGILWRATALVTVVTNADDTTEDQHHAFAEAVFNTITTDSISTDLSAALPDFYCYACLPQRQEWGIQGRAWGATMTFQVQCVGSDIT